LAAANVTFSKNREASRHLSYAASQDGLQNLGIFVGTLTFGSGSTYVTAGVDVSGLVPPGLKNVFVILAQHSRDGATLYDVEGTGFEASGTPKLFFVVPSTGAELAGSTDIEGTVVDCIILGHPDK